MVAQERGGSIVNIGSTSAHRARANALAYPVAKAGVLSLTRSLAVQLAPHRIRVNSVTPNKVGSPVGQDAEPADRGRSNLVDRPAVPGDIAAAVAFLVSDAAGFITAQELVVDGGAFVRPAARLRAAYITAVWCNRVQLTAPAAAVAHMG
jgi:NAD(P)-dependent dehydrogenase (short-subunit alcohol dehydrogenase family)